MIKRVLNFDRKDWSHVWWLFKNMIKQFLLFNFKDAEESWIFLKLHFTNDSTRMK